MKKLRNWFKKLVTGHQEPLHLPQDLRLNNPVMNTAPMSVVPLNYYRPVASRDRGGQGDIAS